MCPECGGEQYGSRTDLTCRQCGTTVARNDVPVSRADSIAKAREAIQAARTHKQGVRPAETKGSQ